MRTSTVWPCTSTVFLNMNTSTVFAVVAAVLAAVVLLLVGVPGCGRQPVRFRVQGLGLRVSNLAKA